MVKRQMAAGANCIPRPFVSCRHRLSLHIYSCFYKNISLPLRSSLLGFCMPGGHMTRAALQSLPGAKDGLVKKYIDKAGKKRMVGVPERLKCSQSLVLIRHQKLNIAKLSENMEEHNENKTNEVLHASFWDIHGWAGYYRAAGGDP